MNVKPDRLMSETITLEPGVTVHGVLLDADSGKPLANRKLRAIALDKKAAKSPFDHWTKTDEMGRFQFSTLEPIQYKISLIVPFGQANIQMGNSFLPLDPDEERHGRKDAVVVTGGQHESVTIRVRE